MHAPHGARPWSAQTRRRLWPTRCGTRGPLRQSEGASTSGSIERRVSPRLVRGDRCDRRPLDVEYVVHFEVELAAAGRDELHREIGLLEEVRAVCLADPFDRDLEDLERHLREVVERLIPVNALLHVDLTDDA